MADTAQSATESALENQRIGALQIRVVAICSLIQICDVRRRFDWLGGPVTHPCLEPATVAVCAGLLVVQSRRHGGRPFLGADR